MRFEPLKITDEFAEKHHGKTAVSSRSGELLGHGEDAMAAIAMAEKKNPDLHPDDYIISRIYAPGTIRI